LDHPFISTLLHSGPVGQSILAGLLLASILTWWVILWKVGALRQAEASSRRFLARFREGGPEWLDPARRMSIDGPLGPVYAEGLREVHLQREIADGARLGPEAMSRIEAALDSEIVTQIAELDRGHVILAIAASASPFVGLFGTVWGIMNAFRGMSLEGSAGIAAVAPGVAEALVTTVAGLAVAIPAVVAYNLLNRRAQLIGSLYDRFSQEFLRAVVLSGRRDARPAPPPAPEAAPVFARRNG
jgi:biopolymer transport protein TolQ